VVTEVHVAHGSQVSRQQVLVDIQNPELDVEFKRVWGELQTARKKQAAVEAERLQMRSATEEDRRRQGQKAAEAEELEVLVDSLEKQYAILEEQQAELAVRSPVDGEVLTWDVAELLDARPVSRGQIILTVADVRGPWQLELRIPDRQMAHVLSARSRTARPLEVSFILATDPARQFRGTIEEVGFRAEVDESGESFVPATVKIDRNEIPQLVPGATVVARIHCGRRAVGYVWLHDLLDALRRWVMF
jgi:hypothetical protein